MRISAVIEKHAKIIKNFYFDPGGAKIIRKMTDLRTITSYALNQ
jgi:hypothetical protein